MLPQEIIRKKRDGQELTDAELKEFFDGYLKGSVADYQAAAMLMAIVLKGMSNRETVRTTELMRDSGKVFSWPFERSQIIDKHSTGGIGDKTSIILMPLCALEGIKMPMMAGRGLGHTGGTLDKLEAIGVNVYRDSSKVEKQMDEIGCVFMGQTEAMVPLDRKLYSIRDVTATVESIPLIVASILSKKLSEGLGGLVMDVKFGSGAFMETFESARDLAQQLYDVGNRCGIKVRCLLTSMEQPLGRAAGNGIEIAECLEVLQGKGPEDCRDLSVELALEMIAMAQPDRDRGEIKTCLMDHLTSGRAFEMFKRIAFLQGADAKFFENPDLLWQAPIKRKVFPTGQSVVQRINVRDLGIAVIEMGGGRRLTSDKIDPWVGLSHLAKVGEPVGSEVPLAVIHARSEADANHAEETIRKAYFLGAEAETLELIRERI